MSLKHLMLLSCIFCTTILLSQCPAYTNSLTTMYAANNGQRGCMFDITASAAVNITCFDANLYPGTTADYEIYYKSGSFIGSENDASAWTLVGTVSNLTSAGLDVPTTIPIPVNVSIGPGQTFGFYITNTYNGGLNYTIGTAPNTVVASDANITVKSGVGKGYPFALNYNYRSFNGTVHYEPGTSLSVELSAFRATPLQERVRLNWITMSETNNDFYTLERSADGMSWEELAIIPGKGNKTGKSSYTWFDESPLNDVSYYRLSQTDLDGAQEYFDIRSVHFTKPLKTATLTLFPNPAGDQLSLEGSKDDLREIRISNILGTDYTDQITVKNGYRSLQVDISALPAGLFIVTCGERSASFLHQ